MNPIRYFCLLFSFSLLTASLKGEEFRTLYSEYGWITYSITDRSAKEVSVASNGGAYNGHLRIPRYVLYGAEVYTVTGVEEDAFRSCRKLKSVQLPATVSRIGDRAFMGCKALERIALSDSLHFIGYEAFRGCAALDSIVLPERLDTLHIGAFYACTSLTSIELPRSLTCIGNSSFSGCKNLVEVVVSYPRPVYIASATFMGISPDAVLFVPRNSRNYYHEMKNWVLNFPRIMER